MSERHLRPAVYGMIRDSITGRPVGGVGIRVRDVSGQFRSDTSGYYLLFGLPVGETEIQFFCPVLRGWRGALIARKRIQVAADLDSLVNVTLPTVGCAEVAERSWSAEFRGHYTVGFETSNFTSCVSLEELRGTAYEGVPSNAWIEFSDTALRESRHLWPRSSEPYPSYFVRWRGTITGPGMYGHLGGSNYRMRVEEVLEVRRPADSDCR